jgi:hypothetical protein
MEAVNQGVMVIPVWVWVASVVVTLLCGVSIGFGIGRVSQ